MTRWKKTDSKYELISIMKYSVFTAELFWQDNYHLASIFLFHAKLVAFGVQF